MIFRREYPRIMQEGGLWDESQTLYPLFGAVSRETPSLGWRFPSGATVRFNHLQREKDKLSWKGAQIPLLEFDQAEEFTESQFWYLCSRLRSMSGVAPYVRATCNPIPEDDEVGGWVHRLLQWWINPETGYAIPERSGQLRWFVRAQDSDDLIWADSREELVKRFGPKVMPKSLTFIRMLLSDNKILMENNPEYEAELLALPLIEREQLYGANWNIRPAAGLIFNQQDFQLVPTPPATPVVARIRYWDKAGTEGAGAYSVGLRMSRTLDGQFVVEDVVRGQWGSLERNRIMLQTALYDGPTCQTWVEQEPGSGGRESADATLRNLAGFDVRVERVTGDKVTRAAPFSAQVQGHNVLVVQASWTKAFLTELHAFPAGRYKDQVDAASGAFNKLVGALIVPDFNPELEFHDGMPQYARHELGGSFLDD